MKKVHSDGTTENPSKRKREETPEEQALNSTISSSSDYYSSMAPTPPPSAKRFCQQPPLFAPAIPIQMWYSSMGYAEHFPTNFSEQQAPPAYPPTYYPSYPSVPQPSFPAMFQPYFQWIKLNFPNLLVDFKFLCIWFLYYLQVNYSCLCQGTVKNWGMFGCFAVYAVLYIQSCNDEAAGFLWKSRSRNYSLGSSYLC